MFPWTKQEAVTVYDITVEGGEPLRRSAFTIEALRDALSHRMLLEKVPESLKEDVKDRWGWAWPDDSGPVSADRWLMWLVRHWKKAPPPTLIAELAKKEAAEWCKNNKLDKCPSVVRNEIKERVREKITRSTPPSIVESPILLDVLTGRLVLFSASESVVESQRGSVMAILKAMTLQPIVLTKWTFTNYLDRARPGAVFPALMPQRFMAWLVKQALRSQWLQVTPPGSTAMISFQLELGDYIETSRSSSGNGKHRVEGHNAVKEYAQELDEDTDVYITRVGFRLNHGKYGYLIRTNLSGEMIKCKIEGAGDWSQSNDDIDGAVLDMADHFMQAWDLMRHLWTAFDNTEVVDLMRELPQKSLWDYEPHEVSYFWGDEGPIEAAPSTPLEDAIDKADG